MRKAAIILILLGLVVVIAANLFLPEPPQTTFAPLRNNTTLRQISSGEVVGFTAQHGARAWQGIAYAEPPTDSNRWRAPQPPAAQTQIIEALAPGPPCPQFASLLSGADADAEAGAITDAITTTITGEEDCLYLNIWSPPNAASLPVMVWIHGGGNTAGHGGGYSGAKLAASRDVVVVTVNYRLGIFGWFSHPALATGDALDDSGNYGTLDIVRALQWLQENVHQFGGNPDNLTVFGESAGGYNVLSLMASPMAAGLFHRAIVQSGGYGPQPLRTAWAYREDGGHQASSGELLISLLLNDKLASNRAAAKKYIAAMSRPRIREYLYSKTPAQLFFHLQPSGFGSTDVPNLFSDGEVLPDLDVSAIFSNPDNHHMVPTVLGSNRDEAALFMASDPRYVKNWLGFLPRLKDPDAYRQLVKYRSLAWKERGVDRLANYMVKAGNPHVYAYRFDWDEQPSRAGFDLSVALGAAHGLEIGFVFDDFDTFGVDYIWPGDRAQHALASRMSDYWTEFARNGTPGSGSAGHQPNWQTWGGQGNMIIFDTEADGGIRMQRGFVDINGLKAALAADQDFPGPADQCAAYAQSFGDSDFIREEYEALNDTCADLNPATLRGF